MLAAQPSTSASIATRCASSPRSAHPGPSGRTSLQALLRRDELDEWRRSARPMRAAARAEGCLMTVGSNEPRRVRVERNIYRRPTGVLEVGFKDASGIQRWRTVDGGIMAARKLRDDLLARRGRGETVAPDSRLRFGEAAELWLAGPVLDLRATTQAGYRSAVEQHLLPRYRKPTARRHHRRRPRGACPRPAAARQERGDDRRGARRGGPHLQVRCAPARLQRYESDHADAVLGAAEGLAGHAPADLHARADRADARRRHRALPHRCSPSPR